MTEVWKRELAPRRVTIEFSARELESVRDLIDSRASSIVEDDVEATRERRMLLGIIGRIEAAGPLREMRGQRDVRKSSIKIGARTPGSAIERRATKGGGQ